MSAYRTKFHQDGTVTLWNVYSQQWERISATDLVAEGNGNMLMPTLTQTERDRILRMSENATRGE